MKPSKLFTSAVVTALLFFQAAAFARDNTQELTDTEVKERLFFIQNNLDEGRFRADLWWRGWFAFQAGGTALYGTLAALEDDRNERGSHLVSMGQSLLGAGGLLINPMVPGYAPGCLRDMPDETPEQRREKLLYAESLLNKSAHRVIDEQSWLNRVLSLVVGVGGSLTMYYAFDQDLLDCGINLATVMAVTETRIRTIPKRPVTDLMRYEKKYTTKLGRKNNSYDNWYLSVYPGGLIAGMKF